MSVQITFHTFLEKKPKHNEDIVYLRRGDSFGFECYELRECQAEYCWFEYEKDELTGCQISYSSRNKSRPTNCKLEILDADGYVFSDEDLWCSVKEYWNYFKAHRSWIGKLEKLRAKQHMIKIQSKYKGDTLCLAQAT